MNEDEFSQVVMHRTAKRLIDVAQRSPDAVHVVANRVSAPLAAEIVNELIASGITVTAAMLWAVPFRFEMPSDSQRVVTHVTAVPWELDPHDGQLHLVPEYER